MAIDPKQRRAERHAHPDAGFAAPSRRSIPITAERITDAALEIIASRGYDALTMRSVAGALDTGPASLYAHVVNKADLNELLIGRLCSQVMLPAPDASRWREQIADVCAQLRDLYLSYPGISQAALAMAAMDLDVLRVSEGMFAIVLAGGIDPRVAAWAIDALFLYVGAYSLETSMVSGSDGRTDDGMVVGREDTEELVRRFAALPADLFPQTRRYAAELTSGSGHDRFDFTVALIVSGLDRDR